MLSTCSAAPSIPAGAYKPPPIMLMHSELLASDGATSGIQVVLSHHDLTGLTGLTRRITVHIPTHGAQQTMNNQVELYFSNPRKKKLWFSFGVELLNWRSLAGHFYFGA